jgi:dihydroneopterin aldolase
VIDSRRVWTGDNSGGPDLKMSRSRDRIFVSRIACAAAIGVSAEERSLVQHLSVDVEVWCDLRAAAASDSIDDTVDYGRIVARVVDLAGGRQYVLLEALAGRIADAVLADLGGAAVRVRVRKLTPPLPSPVGFASVEVFREAGKALTDSEEKDLH